MDTSPVDQAQRQSPSPALCHCELYRHVEERVDERLFVVAEVDRSQPDALDH